MFRLLKASCPRCQNRFQVDAEDAPGVGHSCVCPRCNTAFAVRMDEGTPRPDPLGWAVRATPTREAA